MPGIKLTARAAGTTVNKNAFTGVNVKTAKVYTGDAEYEELTFDEYKNINIGVFFDGTGNNRYNINARKAYERQQKGEKLSTQEANAAKSYTYFFGLAERGGSYTDDESNISRTEPYYFKGDIDKNSIQIRLYIEGIGTQDGKGDSRLGKGLALNHTGVRAKVKIACRRAANLIKDKIGDTLINKITVDTFGFSRGAAAARNFVYEITQRKGATHYVKNSRGGKYVKFKQDYGLLGKHLNKSDELKMLSIRFVGLFDTVVAVGFSQSHENNMRNLHMDSITQARNVFQIASEDEHRANFKLTNIKSVALKSGVQKIFPGVHSDIGGSYVDQLKEIVDLTGSVSFEEAIIEKKRLVEQGWYKEHELKTELVGSGSYSFNQRLIGTRTISNKYSYIPIHIMAKYTKEKRVEILYRDIEDKYPVVGDSYLMATKNILTDYVFNNGEPFSYTNKKYKPLIKVLRNKYFHWSANYGSIGMSPNIENGKRKRVIFDDTLK